MKARDIGIDVKPPEKECDDPNCPFHGHLKVRGQILEGVVISDKMEKTVVVEREYLRYVKKYERYEKRKTKIHARLPDCMKDDVAVGDLILIAETRPISKMIHFVVSKVIRRVGE